MACDRCGKSSSNWKLVQNGPPEMGNVWCADCVVAVQQGAPANLRKDQAWQEKGKARQETLENASGCFGCLGALIAIGGLWMLLVYLHYSMTRDRLPEEAPGLFSFGRVLLFTGIAVILVAVALYRRLSRKRNQPEAALKPVELIAQDVILNCPACGGPLLYDESGVPQCRSCQGRMQITSLVRCLVFESDPKAQQGARELLDRVRDVSVIDAAIQEIQAEPCNYQRTYFGDDGDMERTADAAEAGARESHRDWQRRGRTILDEVKKRLIQGEKPSA